MQITDEMNEELNASTLMTDAPLEEEHGEEEEQAEEEQGGRRRMPPKSPGKKRMPVTYPDDVAIKIINAWRNSPHLYKKEHEGYLLG